MEFTREDWDFILHQDDPGFAQKFDALIRKYACKAYEEASNFPDRRAVGYIYYWTSFDNWLCKMRMRDLDAFLGKKHFEKARLKVFVHHVEAIGMVDDYERLFLASERSIEIFGYGYLKLLEEHKRGYEEEKKAEKEKLKASPIGRILSGPTGDTAGKNRVSDAGQDDEDRTL